MYLGVFRHVRCTLLGLTQIIHDQLDIYFQHPGLANTIVIGTENLCIAYRDSFECCAEWRESHYVMVLEVFPNMYRLFERVLDIEANGD